MVPRTLGETLNWAEGCVCLGKNPQSKNQLRASQKPLKHRGNMVLKGLRGTLNWDLFTPRSVSLSQEFSASENLLKSGVCVLGMRAAVVISDCDYSVGSMASTRAAC